MSQIAIMMVGFSGSGKSELADQIKKKLNSGMALFRSDAVRNFLSGVCSFFQDDFTLFSRSGFEREFSLAIRRSVVDVFLDHGFSVCIDRCFLAKAEREEFLRSLKKKYPRVQVVLIYCHVSESELYKRLREKDREMVKEGGDSTWVNHYESVQKPKFKIPQAGEADYFLEYDNSNGSEVLDKL